MHEKLKFSWSHIIAYLALIGIAYVSYVGLFYNLDSGFVKPGIYTGFIIITLWFWFIGMQKIKGVSNVPLIKYFRFDKSIWVERILFFTAPIVLVICLIPFNHAMNVVGNADNIEKTYKVTISLSEKFFKDYEKYCDQRIQNYTIKLKNDSTTKVNESTINSEVEILRRQLLGDNYSMLKNEVLGNDDTSGWIDKVNKETNVWNVFMIGNIKVIEGAISGWSSDLENLSKVVLSTEGSDSKEIKPFDSDKEILNNINDGFVELRNIYSQDELYKGLNFRTILYGILLYLMLMFPYIVEERHPLNSYRLMKKNMKKK